MEEIKLKPKCSNCHRYYTPEVKSSGLIYKTCSKCRSLPSKSKCQHEILKRTCSKCHPELLCQHKLQERTCSKCHPELLCQHKILEINCSKCHPELLCQHKILERKCKKCSDEPLKIVIKRFISGSRTADKKRNHLDIVNFIDPHFCKLLIDESNDKCCYCDCDLQYIDYAPNLITIERIDNNLGHNKNNVKIACLHCNIKKVGSK